LDCHIIPLLSISPKEENGDKSVIPQISVV